MASGDIRYVDWRTIEHAPQISFDTKDIKLQSELSEEVGRVKMLLPDTVIHIPSGRPNTHVANELLAKIQRPEDANSLRSRLYRALWIDSKNIADPQVLSNIVKESGIEIPNLQEAAREQLHQTLQQWQEQWEKGDFSRNIPALVTEEGNKLLGLPSPKQLSLFIHGDSLNIQVENDATCKLQPRELILITTKDHALQERITTALADYDIQSCSSNDDAIQMALSANPPDLIFLDVESDGYATCHTISEDTQTLIIPIVLLTDNRDDASEIKAFEVGAADFIHKQVSAPVLKARIRTLLRLKRANDLLDEVAHMDPLTEIPNRREYNRVINLEWRQAIRTHKPLSIILVDIDHFKKYNDNYGHIEGDKCLYNFAQLLKRCVHRPTDIVSRYGGEEFVIVLPNTDESGALKIATQLQNELRKLNIPHHYAPSTQQLTICQGIACCTPTLAEKPISLFQAADAALYKAKERGRNMIVSAHE